MPTYERSVTVAAEPDKLFAYLSEVSNLPSYFEQMDTAERTDGEAVHTTATIETEDGEERQVEGEAWFRVLESERRIEWGSEGPNDYHGSLTVSEAGDGCEVAVTISTARVESDEIDKGLERTLANVKRIGEGL